MTNDRTRSTPGGESRLEHSDGTLTDVVDDIADVRCVVRCGAGVQSSAIDYYLSYNFMQCRAREGLH